MTLLNLNHILQEGGLKTQTLCILMSNKTTLDIENESKMSDSDSKPSMPPILARQLDTKAVSMEDHAEIFYFLLPSYPIPFCLLCLMRSR